MYKKLLCLCVVGLICSLSGPAMAEIEVAKELLVDLRAHDLPYGQVPAGATWRNRGTLGNFVATGTPVVQDVAGRKAVTFNGTNFFAGPLSPEGIYGSGDRTIEIWVYNGADLRAEETMVSWGRRGGPEGTNLAFNYGNNASYGAVGHWGAPDMGWSAPHAPCPAPENWWHLVYTYDGTTIRLYVNGQENTTRERALNTHGPHPIRVAAQGDNSGAGVNTATNFTGSIAEVRVHDGALSPEAIALNFETKLAELSTSPFPRDGQVEVPRDLVLSWTPAEFATAHDVYLGTDADEVEGADRANPGDALVSEGQVETALDPGRLAFGTTYHWRVDDVDAAADSTFKNIVWSFTVEQDAYPITGVTATASSSSTDDMGPMKTVDGSGLDADGRHSTVAEHMWLSHMGGPQPTWIQYEFGQVHKVDRMLVWNSNQDLEDVMGLGAKDVVIEYSADGEAWTSLSPVQLAQAAGSPTLTAQTVDLGGIAAKFIRLTIESNWGGILPQYGLSEVRFFYVPVQAREPQPQTGAVEVGVDAILKWRSGRDAAVHDVYFGADAEALPLVDTVADTRYDPGLLDLDTTYYWRIDEVNEAEPVGVWQGNLWSFTTRKFMVIDDFEGYTDDMEAGKAIFQTWIDGDENGTGSTVGRPQAPFAERAVIHSGLQSMPLFYENVDGVSVSEANLTLDPAQDWTQSGVTTLVVHFRGDLNNDAAQFYVAINDSKVVYPGSPGILASRVWTQWNIDLAATGADLQNVAKLSVGVEGSGSGVVYVDDIRLYREAPATVEPVGPSAAPVARYTFDDNVNDASGNDYHGTAMNDPLYDDAIADLGRAIAFNGTNNYVELPIGPLIATLTDMTVTTWVNFPNTGGGWQRLFDFGTGTNNYIFLCPRTGTTGPIRVAIRTPTVGEQIVNSPARIPMGWCHVAVVVDSSTMRIRLYVDGTLVASNATTLLVKDLGETNQNWLARSQYPADAYFVGQLADFAIYDKALSTGEIQYLVTNR
jgi:hypothetical protein